VKLNSYPDFSNIEGLLKKPVLDYLNDLSPETFNFQKPSYIAEHFSPYNQNERQYLTTENALKIDAIRQTLYDWHLQGIINDDGAMYLLATLLEAVPGISNIAGTYGAYLKHWDPRTKKPLKLENIHLVDNGWDNRVYNQNANELINSISGQFLYIDPPYNSRQYLGNYHLLETIAKYDNPVLKGKTGLRIDPAASSDYCKRSLVAKRFTELIEKAQFENIFISYNTEGLLKVEELSEIVANHTIRNKMKIYKFPYRRYSRVKDKSKPKLFEVVISAVK
jgi:adenine-specific DNA-methyltransferase